MRHSLPWQCELIAPAGDWDSARAAVENGADAVYFGLQNGMNARARAANFRVEELPELMFYLHRSGVKGFLALNTLVFTGELAAAEQIARQSIRSGIDAIIVQDLGLLRLILALSGGLPIHASTQMTLSSVECIQAAEDLGVKRVVLPRESSLDRIKELRRATSIELEVFVHGALCISYSGQCLASLALGGRSGNRGQCAQSCRMVYELLGKGGISSEESRRYWLSPGDLCLLDRLPELLAAGVSALKIEGRMKGPEYVALTTRCYRMALDAALHGRSFQIEPRAREELEVAFSRGFSHGWLDGPRHRSLVPGDNAGKRGLLVGEVLGVRADRVRVRLLRSVRRGQGVVFENQRDQDSEQGGRIYEIFFNGESVTEAVGGSDVELAFGENALDIKRIQSTCGVYRTDDPRLTARLRKSFDSLVPLRRVDLDLTVRAIVGENLHIEGWAMNGAHCSLESAEPLPEAVKHPLTPELLREQLGRLGRTAYQLRSLDARIDGNPMIPLSVLGQLRKAMVESLDKCIKKTCLCTPPEEPVLPGLRKQTLMRRAAENRNSTKKPLLHVLCRSAEQIEAVLALDVDTIYAELPNVEDCADMASAVRFTGKKLYLVTTRIHLSGAAASLECLAHARPDGVLARHLAGIVFFRRAGLPVIADFSLNAANDLAMETLLDKGADRVTAAFDLNEKTFTDMVRLVDPSSVEVILHCHVPMFHTAYCLYSAALSQGDVKPRCGRPCMRETIRLRDRKGCEHPTLVDGDCRNTVFHARAQSLVEFVARLSALGVRHFRVELLDHGAAEAAEIVGLYRDLLDGRRDAKDVLKRLSAGRSGNPSLGTWRF